MPRQRVQPSAGNPLSRTKASKGPSGGRSNLQSIPLELRQEIFEYLIYDSSKDLLNLMLTSTRMAKEATPFLYKRPPIFDGQYEFFDWLDAVDHEHLPHVTEIRMKLVDIDPENIVGALGKRLREARADRDSLRSGPHDNPYYEACYHDLKRIQAGFNLLPGMKTFTVLDTREGDARPPMPMLENFSKMLSQCFPDLTTLISRQPLFPIHFAADKPKLRRLRIAANSQTSEDEVAAISKRMTANLHLEVSRCDPCPQANQFQWSCVTEILCNAPPLRGLSLIEDFDEQPSDLLDETFVESVDGLKRHMRSLKTLSLMADPPDDGQRASLMRRNLLRFMESSQLRTVEVLGLYASVYRHLPATTEKFILRLDRWCCDAEGSLADILDELMGHIKYRVMNKDPQIPRLGRLRSIEVWLHYHVDLFEPADDDEEDPRALEQKIKAQLSRVGLHFSLVVLDPDHEDDNG